MTSRCFFERARGIIVLRRVVGMKHDVEGGEKERAFGRAIRDNWLVGKSK
jgi:hypothetical protein